MTVWLYQMSAENYSIEDYREEIWEKEIVKWSTRNVRTLLDTKISPGDTVIFVFARTGAQEPGIYGWGIVTSYREEGYISFRPTFPSDYLKMNPIWDDELSNLLDVIRGPVKVGTMWEIENDIAVKLKKKVHDWIK